MKRTVGIFGGSFDPIHNGHLEVARQALLQCGLSEVWLMVSPENPLKQDRKKTPEEIRLKIARVAVDDFINQYPQLAGKLKVSDFEFSLPRPSYTISTLDALSDAYPDCRFRWIAGGDNLRCLDRWKDADRIRNEYGFIIYPRETLNDDIAPDGVTILHDIKLLDISSSQIRAISPDAPPSSFPLPLNAAKEWLNYLHKS